MPPHFVLVLDDDTLVEGSAAEVRSFLVNRDEVLDYPSPILLVYEGGAPSVEDDHEPDAYHVSVSRGAPPRHVRFSRDYALWEVLGLADDGSPLPETRPTGWDPSRLARPELEDE